MRRFAIRLAIALAALLVASQFLLPPYLEHRVASSLTQHGGTASVDLAAIPAVRLLFAHGRKLHMTGDRLSVDLQGQRDVFKRLDNFSDVRIDISQSRAGPFSVGRVLVTKAGNHSYAVAIAGDATAGDVARYAGTRLGGASVKPWPGWPRPRLVVSASASRSTRGWTWPRERGPRRRGTSKARSPGCLPVL